jgi:hypothetical protein
MEIEIKRDLELTLYGFHGMTVNKDYVGTAFKLSDQVWKKIREKRFDHKGMNIWVYGSGEIVFAGVEFNSPPVQSIELEQKNILLPTYAYYKHVGPYHIISKSGKEMTGELKRLGFETTEPYIEIYGHWTADETKLETELIMAIK